MRVVSRRASADGKLGPVIDVGTVLRDRYEITSLLAHGGMSDVFAARDLALERTVAVKVVRGTTPDQRQRLEREAMLLARFEHPNLVRIFDAQHDGDEAYVVLEYVDGPTLADTIREGPLPSPRVAHIGAELSDALAYIHARGVIHRDVKPSNIFVAADGRVRLSDFGIARHEDDTQLTQTGMAIGTGAYMAPEQVQAMEVGPPADVYALGLVLVECLTGRPVYTGTAAEAALARLTRGPDLDAVAAGWRSLLSDMTARDAGARPPASTCAARLRNVGSSAVPGSDTEVLPAPAPVPAVTGDNRPWRTFALAAIITVTIGLLTLLVWARSGDEGTADSTTTTTVTTLASTTTSTTRPTTTTSHCAALRAQRDALDQQEKDLDQQLKGRALRDAKEQLDKQRSALDKELESC